MTSSIYSCQLSLMSNSLNYVFDKLDEAKFLNWQVDCTFALLHLKHTLETCLCNVLQA